MSSFNTKKCNFLINILYFLNIHIKKLNLKKKDYFLHKNENKFEILHMLD